MNQRTKSLLKILYYAVLTGLVGYFVWLLVNYFPLLAASPKEVESARAFVPKDGSLSSQLIFAALDRTKLKVSYDGTYTKIGYPNGDVQATIGVCADEVIRCYRIIGIDLQKLVHEDMAKHFEDYPKRWGLSEPDTNIDHRRVPNLHQFFSRQGASLPATQNASDYLAGDVVTYGITGIHPHIAIVVPSPAGKDRPWILHNHGFGPHMEDQLFHRTVEGHFRWFPITRN